MLFQQSERYNIPFTHICKKLDIPYEWFAKGYANISNLETAGNHIKLHDEQLIEIGKILGLGVRVVIVIKDEKVFEESVQTVKKELRDGYRSNRKEKGDTSGIE